MRCRMWLGISLLTLFLALGIFASLATDRVCKPISKTLEEAGSFAAAGRLDAGAALAVQASKKWDKNWNMLAMVADHSPMDEIDGLFAQAKIYAQTGAIQDFCTTCARLSQLVKAVAEAHSLTWWNLI